jgi:ABC-type Fe3+ transport system substrate-binding protein
MKQIILLLLLLFCTCAKEPLRELLIISPHTPEIKKEFGFAFSAYYEKKFNQIINVRWIDVGGTGEAVEYVKSRNGEGRKAGGVDCFFGGGDLPFMTLEGLNLLEQLKIPDSLLGGYPEFLDGIRLRSDKLNWIGAALSGFGIIYNKVLLEQNKLPVPLEWKDLALPLFHGFIAIGDPRYSGTIHVMFEIILQSYGWDEGWKILYGMTSNARSFDKGGSLSAKSVAMGQAAAGISIDFYAAAEVDKFGEHRLGFVIPTGKSVVTPDGIAILKHASNPDIAQEFVRFVLGKGQYLWLKKRETENGPLHNTLCRMAADSTVYAKINLQEMIKIKSPFIKEKTENSFIFNSNIAGRRWSIINDLMATTLITPARELREIPGGTTALLTPPITEEEAMTMATSWTKQGNAIARVKKMNDWSLNAIRKYRTLKNKRGGAL